MNATPTHARRLSALRSPTTTRLARVIAAASLMTLIAAPAFAAPVTTLPGHQMQLQRNEHALGLTVGYGGANGFAYRKYLGNSFVQANLLPLVADRGDFLAIMFGLSYGQYLIVWNRPRARALMPTTTALRAIATASTYFTRDSARLTAADAPTGIGVNSGTTTKTTSSSSSKIENLSTLAAGIGFEFGAIQRNGFSMSVDVMLTSAWDEKGFLQILPLPYASVMYSW